LKRLKRDTDSERAALNISELAASATPMKSVYGRRAVIPVLMRRSGFGYPRGRRADSNTVPERESLQHFSR
jgi:hypothetical protein